MSHPAIVNLSAFYLEPLFLADEEMRPLFVPVVKATFRIQEDSPCLALADEQVPVNVAGEYWGDPETSSTKYEPEVAFFKPATDVVLIGHAQPPEPGLTEMDVGFRVGALQKLARVFGDRVWYKKLGTIRKSAPEPIERIPLIAERAFGGWDRRHPNPKKHAFEPRNPVGTGFRKASGRFEEGVKLPNIEDPRWLVKRYRDVPQPMLFGFTSPHWAPRSKLAGTYGKKWQKERMPLLPRDFDRRFFNAAPPDMVAKGYLRGDEPVVLINASPRPRLSFYLPGLPPPKVRVELTWGEEHVLETRLDTVIVNTDEERVFLLWRAHLALRRGPLDVRAIEALPIASAVGAPAGSGVR